MSLTGKNILLVENSRAKADLVREAFREAAPGARLQVAPDLGAARRLLDSEPFDLAVIDLVTEADGRPIDLLETERRRHQIPVIILTEHGSEDSAVAALKAGALDYIVKSDATLRALPQLIEAALREWQHRLHARQAEQALRSSEARYRDLSRQFEDLLDGIPDTLLLLDPELRIEWINLAGRESLARCGEPGPGPFCYEVFHQRTEPCDGCPVVASFRSGRTEDNLIPGRDGKIWGIKAFPLKGPDGAVQKVIGLASEVTQKIRLRSEAVRASQLATLGELAAGVAHEINNPANGIINYGQLLLDRSPPESREKEIAREIIDEGVRIARTVRNLLTFAQGRSDEPTPVQVTDIMAACLDLCNSQLKKEGIRLDLELEPDLPPVFVQNQPIQQVVLNLISNARYALNEKYPPKHSDKRLVIRGSRVTGTAGPRVRLEFTDYGIGIARQVLNRVMDPFFTTKPSDRGTGLGLSMSREVIRKQGGSIDITSVEGQSTTVVIELPVNGEGGAS